MTWAELVKREGCALTAEGCLDYARNDRLRRKPSAGRNGVASLQLAAQESGRSGTDVDAEEDRGDGEKDVAVEVFGLVQVNKVGRGHAQGLA